jgi:hypothetical protein
MCCTGCTTHAEAIQTANNSAGNNHLNLVSYNIVFSKFCLHFNFTSAVQLHASGDGMAATIVSLRQRQIDAQARIR